MDIANYLNQVSEVFKSGAATELSYRAALEGLFQSIDPDIQVINEPKRSEGGMPDFLFQRDGVAFGWCEAKDIDKDVIKLKGYSVEQRKRYENAYPNLLYTNGVDFQFIQNKEVVNLTSIAEFMGDLGGLQPLPGNFPLLERQLKNFAQQKPISIKSAQKLAEMMAAKAAIIKDEIGIALTDDPEFLSGLGRQYSSFKQNLLPHLTPGEFADIYAETITYGMFAARLHDDTLDTFSRAEALEKLPKSNPFLRGLFQYIAGYDIPDRLRRIVDELADVLRASDPHSLFADFGKFTARNDPFIHFYETFLAAYNPKKRKSRGVWYTPEPVVDFIVRAVDDVLKSEFGLADGLADTSKVTVDWDTGETKKGKPVTIKKEMHRVQILDPATGTGTFLAKAVQLIADRVKARAPGKWSGYVAEDLLPRLHGFELLMASYAMCHMKLDMQLTDSGYVPSKNPPRLSVWLTNALEPAEREVKDLFFQPLAEEARGASDVKRQTPIMCVIGNPPYSGESQNKGDHIMGLMEAYKKEPGGKEKLKERNPKWINDDYVKFIRMSEDLIAQNPSGGVLGFVTNHGYLDNPTFRGMRWHLLKTFDKIYVLDLHGNSKKKEVSPDGSPDKNVFDIMQGVAVIIAVRKGDKSPVIASKAKQSSSKKSGEKSGSPRRSAPRDDDLAEVWHGDLWGSRKAKGEALGGWGLSADTFLPLTPVAPKFDILQRDEEAFESYSEGFWFPELFKSNSVGMVTSRDAFTLAHDKQTIWNRAKQIIATSAEELTNQFSLRKDVRDWKISWAKSDVTKHLDEANIVQVNYRPFDFRWTLYTGNSRGFHCYPRNEIMRNFRGLDNFGILLSRSATGQSSWQEVQCTDKITEFGIMSTRPGNGTPLFPLYLYPDDNAEQGDAFAATTRTLNLDPDLYAKICAAAAIDPADTDMAREANAEKAVRPEPVEGAQERPVPTSTSSARTDFQTFREASGEARPSEVKVFDYIYGVLHSPEYRETFAEFLKIDFPRVPYPANPETFKHVSEKGEQLRRLHLMEAAAIGEAAFPFMPEDMSELEDDERDVVAAAHPKWKDGRVYINKVQYFADVPETAWSFHIGGYQPAQKWLKDRKGRVLSWEDTGHYQSIIKILLETDRIMKEIELPLETAAP